MTDPNPVHRMDLKGAQALAKHLTDPQANPPVYAEAQQNGPKHKAVVHVTFGKPKAKDVTDKDGTTKRVTPERPAPYTVA